MQKMQIALRTACLLIGAIWQVGCSAIPDIGPLPNTPALVDTTADRLFVDARTAEQRRLRVCYAYAIGIALETDQVMEEELTRAPAVFMMAEDALAGVDDLMREPSKVWTETTLFRAREPLYGVAIDRAKAVAPSIILAVTTGSGVLDRLRHGSRRTGLAAAMVSDVRNGFARMDLPASDPDRLAAADLWQACRDEIALSRDTLRPLVRRPKPAPAIGPPIS